MSRRQSHNVTLNVHLDVAQNYFNLPDGSHTPNTPEILNSIVNMQANPFQGFLTDKSSTNCKPFKMPENNPARDFEQNLNSKYEQTSFASPSVEQYRSQFIKEGLRIKLAKDKSGRCEEAKQVQLNPPENRKDSLQSLSASRISARQNEATDEDKIRRQRRRERNKLAATKCRDKKKIWTQHLFSESESLNRTNRNLKLELHHLEQEKEQLVKILKLHEAFCKKKTNYLLKFQDEFENHTSSNSSDSMQGNLSSDFNTNKMYTRVPSNFKTETNSQTEEEIPPPSYPGPYPDPPSFENFSRETEVSFVTAWALGSAYLNSYNHVQRYHGPETHCMAL